jgi:hypothetical protein
MQSKKNNLDVTKVFWVNNTWLTCEMLSQSGNPPHVLIVETELNPECNWNKSSFYGPYLGDYIDFLIKPNNLI